jgi:hypothetical protein
VRDEETAGVETREDEVEELLVIGLPRIEEHEVERALQLGDLFERVGVHHANDVVQAGLPDVGGRLLRALRVVLDRHHLAAALAGSETEPDTAVAARRADLEHRFGAARGDEHAQKPPILLGDRQLALVDGLDGFENRFDLRRERSGRSRLRAIFNHETDDNHETERNDSTHRAIVLLRRAG